MSPTPVDPAPVSGGAAPDEVARLAALRELGILDSGADQAFDDLTALAAEMLGVPIALVSLVDAERQWFKSHHGLASTETPRSWSFCAHAIRGDGLFEIPDAAADPRFRDNPLVTGEPGIRFYAGVPLRLDDGPSLGTLCVIDDRPRQLSETQRDTLLRLARQAQRLLDLWRSERERARAAQSLRRLALVVQRTDNVVILADADGRTTWVNPAFERVTGYRAEEAIGRRPGELLQFDGTAAGARAELSAAVRERRACRVQILNRAKNGRPYWMDVDLQPLHDEAGGFEGFVALETDITEVVRQREHAQALLDVLPAGVLLQGADGRVRSANPAACQILDARPEDLVGQPAARVIGFEIQGTTRQRTAVRSNQGETRWLDLRSVDLPGPDGRPDAALACFTDETLAVRTDALLQTAIRAADLGAWGWEPDSDRWTLSPNWTHRLGIAEGAADWRDRVHPDDMQAANEAMKAVLRGEQATYRMEFRCRLHGGDWRWLLSHAAVSERGPDGRVRRVSGVLMDVDERRRIEERLRHAATTDALTGLPNRSLLSDRLGRALAACLRRERKGALLFLDLDHFKRVNDTHGHAVGDALLQQVAARLLGCLRAEDTLARMGGDEMMVLLPDAGADVSAALLAAGQVASKLGAALAPPVVLDGVEFRVGASIGITAFPRDDRPTVADLIREADTAMYAAKQQARGSVSLYEARMHTSVSDRVRLERALRQAIDGRALELHLQGQWHADGRLAGYEALSRWHDTERGAVSPADFIPLAEESGLIVPLGRLVIERACQLARELQALGRRVPIAINISPRQFVDPGFAGHLLKSVRQHGIEPGDLQLELTESMLADEATERLMNLLAGQGFRFSIDDFGTGWSSLAYLKRLPVHELKIDRTFVRDLVDDAGDAALVDAIIGLARRFGIVTVAEGVETADQARALVAAGCDRLQGFLFDRPQPPARAFAAPAVRILEAAGG